jgi:hypothetical protein
MAWWMQSREERAIEGLQEQVALLRGRIHDVERQGSYSLNEIKDRVFLLEKGWTASDPSIGSLWVPPKHLAKALPHKVYATGPALLIQRGLSSSNDYLSFR